MTKTVTIPIKCSTIKKVKDSLPIILFWIVVAGCIIGMGLLIRAATRSGANLYEIILGSLVFAAVGFLFLWMSNPYEFKCIQE
jgi:hypothetical protein